MYHLFNVLFDDSTKEEKLFFYKLIQNQDTKEYASVLVTDYPSKAIGSFLFDFVSLDFSCGKLFVNLLVIIVLKHYYMLIILIDYVILIIHL